MGIQKVRTELTVLASSILAWLAGQFGDITFSEGKEPDVKKICDLLNEDSKKEEDVASITAATSLRKQRDKRL